MTMDVQSWGYRRTMTSKDVISETDLLALLARTISCNGNLLINVGPTAYGRIPPIFEERLRSLGRGGASLSRQPAGHWVRHHAEAVYGTRPWIYQNDTYDGNVWYTSHLRNHSNYVPVHDKIQLIQFQHNSLHPFYLASTGLQRACSTHNKVRTQSCTRSS
jgi:alpha-L-fucosidase